MTIEDTIKKWLFDRGMFENQCNAVLERMKADPTNEAMAGRWTDTADGYPPQIMNIMWHSAKQEALAFIDETCPLAWFRPMFV